MACADADAVLETEGADGVECKFGYTSFAGSSAVDFGIMHNDELAVGSALQVKFNDVHAHVDCRLDGRQRVLRPIAPICTMRSDEHAFAVGVEQVCAYLFTAAKLRLRR